MKKTKITNERQLILKEFMDRLNSARKPPFKPLAPSRLGMLMRYMSVEDMKVFLADCNYAKSFSKYFWYKMNPKNYG